MGLGHKIAEKFRRDANFSRLGRGIVIGGKALLAATGHYLTAKIPIARWLPNYVPIWVVDDMIAGISTGLLLVPQALAFSGFSGIPLRDGLLAAWLPPLIYSIMGTSKDISTGPTSVTALLSGQFIAGIVKVQPRVPPVFISAVLAFGVGFWSLILGLLNLGFLFDLLSGPIVDGFLNGLSQIVLLAQLPAILGLTGITPVFTQMMPEIIAKLSQVKPTTIGIGLTGIVLLAILQIVGKKWGHKHPIIRIISTSRHLTIIGIFTIISYVVNKDLQVPVWRITGQIPQGLLPASLPNTQLLQSLLIPTLTLAFTTILEHATLARSFGRIHGYHIDQSQELVYLGITNIANSMLGGTPVGGGDLARAAVNSTSGVRSPLSGIFTSAVVLLAAFKLGDILRWIPEATIAAVIIVPVVEVMPPISQIFFYWRVSFIDFIALIISFNLTLLASAELGIGLAVAFMIFYTLFRTMFTRTIPVTNNDLENQHNPGHSSWWTRGDVIPDGTQVIAVPRDMVYLNSHRMKTHIIDTILTNHYGMPPSTTNQATRLWNYRREKHITSLRKKAEISGSDTFISRLRILVLDFKAVSFIDTSAMQSLSELKKEIKNYAGSGVEMRFVGMNTAVRRRFQRFRWALSSPHEGKEDFEVKVKMKKINLDADGDGIGKGESIEVEEGDMLFEHMAAAVMFQNQKRFSASDFNFEIGGKAF